ncbi:protein of unknown function (plasmid) [Cupriavidus taiwanensis]|uniref:Uncharacterized protein n=1 Tax=Cupriavidus taiwanensis TaxID=164546 RepID=A0A7Z7JGF4_9BURK|nr:hypothetical protein CBM2597_U40013 [Cupriavidus taiwanensis]SOZ97214.1 hypothetical protein CBM2598_U40010 [Cupriavidus taiwanensis]SPC26107.1 hypothetical protein CBM2594_U40012 [Cupriavidus taiwanensis]SPD37761.1 protein of unknown function [Cupriavidus taiwanensis]
MNEGRRIPGPYRTASIRCGFERQTLRFKSNALLGGELTLRTLKAGVGLESGTHEAN